METPVFQRTSVFIASAIILGITTTASALEFGPLKVGGAMRANYTQGDYTKDDSGAPQRGGNGGNFGYYF